MKLLLLLVVLQGNFSFASSLPPQPLVPISPTESIAVKSQLPVATPEDAAFWKKACEELRQELKAERQTIPIFPRETSHCFTVIFNALHLLTCIPDLTFNEVAVANNAVYEAYEIYRHKIDPKIREEMELIEKGFMWREIGWLHKTLQPQPPLLKPQPIRATVKCPIQINGK